MPKVITIYLTDEEAKEIERLCEEKGIARYALIKIAIGELCAGSSSSSIHNPSDASPRAGNPSSFKEYLKMARYRCANCHFPLPKERLESGSCPMCGHTKYEEV